MNELVRAFSEGILDAGVRHYANYPGFHSNELHDALGAMVTSTDEKNAFAFAWGCSMVGERAAVSFKNVGLNDAADAFLGAMFAGCRAGLVLFLFDDCDIQHSQNRFDVRPYFLVHGGLWLEPRSVPEAYRFARDAFAWSEQFEVPVVVRATNILWDQGLSPSSWERAPLPPKRFEPLRRLANSSPYVVHPSEARRMEESLARKNAAIEEFVESLAPPIDPSGTSSTIVFGARRGVADPHALRLCTLPPPAHALCAFAAGRAASELTTYEHGATDFAAKLVDEALAAREARTIRRNMGPAAGFRPKYHNNAFMEKLFSAFRSIPGSIVCGDLGSYTMDPARTLQLCLCYGVSPAVAMGVAESAPQGTRVFCITGDGAYLHSGQACLHEMAARQISASVFVLENGGTLGTGGQPIPGDLCAIPACVRLGEIDYADCSSEELRAYVASLPNAGINLTIVHTHENEIGTSK